MPLMSPVKRVLGGIQILLGTNDNLVLGLKKQGARDADFDPILEVNSRRSVAKKRHLPGTTDFYSNSKLWPVTISQVSSRGCFFQARLSSCIA